MMSILRRVIRRVHADMAGVSLVEMLVAMGVFMLFSSMFVVSIVQFVRSNAMDGVRSQSASQISTVMQRVGSDATNAAGSRVTHDSSGNPVVVMLIPKAATGTSSASATDSSGMCVALTAAKNSDGDTVVIRRTKTAEASSTYAGSGQVILTSVVPSSGV
ncbi:MAG: hypothetical protein LKF35_06165, partial [Bifidobacterium minimum]|nr:hypothetical protein [Bifidobacterium minimum]